MRALICVLLIGCGGTSVVLGEGGVDGSSDGSTTMDSTTGNDGGFMSMCKAPPINLTFENCPPVQMCGGNLQDGKYFYTQGCIPDPWAAARMACPTLKISEQKGTVVGCVTFASGAVSRDVTATYGAKLDLPPACTFNQPCSTAEGPLKQYFMNASCVPGAQQGSCTCTVSTTTASIASGGYQAQGNQLVTTTNNRYDYCVQGNTLHLHWASGPTAEPGIYQLVKQ